MHDGSDCCIPCPSSHKLALSKLALSILILAWLSPSWPLLAEGAA